MVKIAGVMFMAHRAIHPYDCFPMGANYIYIYIFMYVCMYSPGWRQLWAYNTREKIGRGHSPRQLSQGCYMP